jgi:hypothetical protein
MRGQLERYKEELREKVKVRYNVKPLGGIHRPKPDNLQTVIWGLKYRGQ